MKKDPHHQQGSGFRPRRRSYPRRAAALRTADLSRSLARPLRVGEARGEGPRARFFPWSTISVVNYLLKVGDQTTPTFDDISLTTLRIGQRPHAS
jgi:hypothetical protein